MDGFCFNKGHFNHAGATETEIMPKHFGRKPYGRNNGRYYGRKSYGRTLLANPGGSNSAKLVWNPRYFLPKTYLKEMNIEFAVLHYGK